MNQVPQDSQLHLVHHQQPSSSNAQRDHQAHAAHQDLLATQDKMEVLEPQVGQAEKDHQGNVEHQVTKDPLDRQDQLAHQERQDGMELWDRQGQ